MNDRVKKAHEFAKEKHKGQKRKYVDIDYLTHLENTANLLWQANENVETDILVAALLHDTVGDTQTTFKEIDQNFGREVRILVEELTFDKEKQDDNLYLTKKINKMSEKAFTIKLCDRLDNVISLNTKSAPLEFIEKYVKETSYIIVHLDRKITDIQQELLNRIKSMLLYLKLSGRKYG